MATELLKVHFGYFHFLQLAPYLSFAFHSFLTNLSSRCMHRAFNTNAIMISEALSETEKTARRDVVRLGARPYTFEELLQIAEKPWDYGTYLGKQPAATRSTFARRFSNILTSNPSGIHELTIALHWTWNQMHESRKKARQILRTRTGHVGKEERVRSKVCSL